MNFKGKKILFLAPHTDDVELGCGATLARCVEEGACVHIVVFSTASKSLPAGYGKNTLELEFVEAMKAYGIDRSKLTICNYEVRRLNYHRQEILEDLVKINYKICPDYVFTTSGNDVHQDHSTVHNEALRAFKRASVLCYELPWNQFSFTTNVFINVTENHLKVKLRALQCYRTQIIKNRNYFEEEFIFGLAKVRGVQAGTAYAEAFELVTLKL